MTFSADYVLEKSGPSSVDMAYLDIKLPTDIIVPTEVIYYANLNYHAHFVMNRYLKICVE